MFPSLFHPSVDAATGIAAALAGVFLWSIAEYALHRVLGHDARTMPNAFGTEHTRHHSEGDYFAPTWKKALVAAFAVPLLGALAALLVGPWLGVGFALAFVSTYGAYEWLHRRMHTHRGIGAYGRFVRRHHFHHHFGNPRANHGVTSPLWDLAFGTFEASGRIRVPHKLCMSWLLDEESGEVAADLRSHYELRGRASQGG